MIQTEAQDQGGQAMRRSVLDREFVPKEHNRLSPYDAALHAHKQALNVLEGRLNDLTAKLEPVLALPQTKDKAQEGEDQMPRAPAIERLEALTRDVNKMIGMVTDLNVRLVI